VGREHRRIPDLHGRTGIAYFQLIDFRPWVNALGLMVAKVFDEAGGVEDFLRL
jgi:hypothetical protein